MPAGRPRSSVPQLLAAARRGDRSALGRLLEACRPYLLAVANRELDTDLRPKGGASDLVNETCVTVVQKFSHFQGHSLTDLRAWLRHILLNHYLDFRRRYKETAKRDVRREVSLDTSDSSRELREQLILNTPGPEDQLLRAELVASMQHLLDRLPQEYCEVIRLRQEQKRTFAEIGRLTGRSEDAARMMWGRAIARLRKELGGED